MGKLLLIFDGFDEMADRVDNQKMINNFWELAKVVVPGSKAILTSRTEHFPESQRSRALLNAELKASTSALSGEPPQFEVLELEKFNEEQIRQVLSFKTNEDTVQQILDNSQLLDLARRPLMTELILEALPEIESGKPIDMSRIYLYAIQEKMRRDIKSERTFTSLADKLYFLCELSWEMISTDSMSLNYRLFPERLRQLFGSVVQEQKELDHWHFDMMCQTMLIRNEDGDYMPAHRSLLEFFVAYKFAAELGILADDFIEIAQEQSCVNSLEAVEYTWSEYYSRNCLNDGSIETIKPLKKFKNSLIKDLITTVGKEPLSFINNMVVLESDEDEEEKSFKESQTAIRELLIGMISSDINLISNRLVDLLKETRNYSMQEAGYLGGNISTILLKTDPEGFRNRDLTRVKISNADLSDSKILNCCLKQSEFNNVILNNASFQNCNFTNAKLKNIIASERTKFHGSDFSSAHISNLDLSQFTFGWISSMADFDKKSTGKIKWQDLEKEHPRILFFYNHDSITVHDRSKQKYKVSDQIVQEIQSDEVRILYVLTNGKVIWQQSIHTNFLLQHTLLYTERSLGLLTKEGECIEINLDTGNRIKPISQNILDNLLMWKDSDFSQVTGLSPREAYLLKILGAINTPEIPYDFSEIGEWPEK